MSQILLPPPNAGSEELILPATITTPATLPTSLADLYAPEPPKQQPPFWRAIKWPLRQIIKGIYLTGVLAKRHRVVAVIVLAVVLVLALSGYAAYQVVQQQEIAREQGNLTASINLAYAPNASHLPLSVLHFLHSQQTFNAQEEWTTLSQSMRSTIQQQGGSVSAIQQNLDQARTNGLKIDRFVSSGGYTDPDTSVSHYTVEAYAELGGARKVLTWFFVVNSAGAIDNVQNLTPSQP